MKRVHSLLSVASLSLAAAAPAAPAPDQSVPAPAPAAEGEDGVVLGYDSDRFERMTVPVSIDGKGPFRFIVDTGAERTVIAREVAENLDLDSAGPVRMHSMTEVSDIDTVAISDLDVGGKRVSAINAPALEQRHLGADGMLGVDSLQSQRVSFDFQREQMTVSASRKKAEYWPPDTIVVTAKNRFGRLVLIDASVEGQKVWVIIDTGSQATIGNLALRRKLEKRHRLRELKPVELLSVTGGRMMANQTLIHRIRLGDVDIEQLPVAFADAHPFRKLDLLDRPALLLGMDALRLFERVSVDFPNRRVRLLATPRAVIGPPPRMAAASGARPGG
ncbi:MAG TPA: retroviral-like aspartic protease family protein [Allosphingosinicella sp.]